MKGTRMWISSFARFDAVGSNDTRHDLHRPAAQALCSHMSLARVHLGHVLTAVGLNMLRLGEC